jgi:hypothetical protein
VSHRVTPDEILAYRKRCKCLAIEWLKTVGGVQDEVIIVQSQAEEEEEEDGEAGNGTWKSEQALICVYVLPTADNTLLPMFMFMLYVFRRCFCTPSSGACLHTMFPVHHKHFTIHLDLVSF